jgi:hypothetical protein
MENTSDTQTELRQAERDLTRIASQRKPLPPYSEVQAARAKVARLRAQAGR